MQYAVSLIVVLTFGCTKLSVLLFYKRIFKAQIFQALLWVMIALTIVWIIGFFFSQLLQCIPFSVNFSKYGNLPGQCIDVNRMMIAQAWSDVVTNFVILLLPIPNVCHYLMLDEDSLTPTIDPEPAIANRSQARYLLCLPSRSTDGGRWHR